ncbi:damage-inducible protein CinA [Vibrio sp. HA2012]|uniref:nicotinamide-nucleotide amidase n=1 Tax=Vibrio sp. HA2012 TaxID=1971595 RepID=UPI000C2C5361|nr:nicotinamide-nucleotide amidase [Vibrio sp. HA2012]PJC86393.1 damage-inducible protein CinA [Vibrio sp. HA2012]
MEQLKQLSQITGQLLQATGETLVTAESCTGGGIASAVTDIAGSSAWFDRAFVTYSNAAKMEMLGVRADTLDKWGAVSEQVVEQMAQGALLYSGGTISVAVSGIAGPDGGSEEKPVGTVWFAWQKGDQKVQQVHQFNGDREAVRKQACITALLGVNELLEESLFSS